MGIHVTYERTVHDGHWGKWYGKNNEGNFEGILCFPFPVACDKVTILFNGRAFLSFWVINSVGLSIEF